MSRKKKHGYGCTNSCMCVRLYVYNCMLEGVRVMLHVQAWTYMYCTCDVRVCPCVHGCTCVCVRACLRMGMVFQFVRACAWHLAWHVRVTLPVVHVHAPLCFSCMPKWRCCDCLLNVQKKSYPYSPTQFFTLGDTSWGRPTQNNLGEGKPKVFQTP